MPAKRKELVRCPWAGQTPLMIQYHDEEWGVPTHSDVQHYEFLVLEAAQAGLSWSTVLKRRDGYRKAFANFKPELVTKFTARDVNRLVKDSGIIRNRMKIEAAIHNAGKFLEIQKEFGSFDNYFWGFLNHKVLQNQWKNSKGIPATTKDSDKISADLKKRGFKFVGSTVIYAHMQAVGMVNDHLTTCFRYKPIQKLAKDSVGKKS